MLSESEPTYKDDGEFHIDLSDDLDERLQSLASDEEQLVTVLDEFVNQIECELHERFEFEE